MPQSPILPADPATPDPAPGPRERAGNIAAHLDMAVIGAVCNSIGLAGYRSVLASFLDDPSGSQATLLAALDRADRAVLRARAHAVKGAAASLGLTAVHRIAERLEGTAEALDQRACAEAAAELRARLQTARQLLQRLGFA